MKIPSPFQQFLQKPEVKEVLKHIANDESEPSPWLEALKVAHQCESNFDWDGAEKAYLQATETAENSNLQAMAYKHLSSFYTLMGRNQESIEAARKATEIAVSSESPLSLMMALDGKARLSLKTGNLDLAENLIEQLLEVVKDDMWVVMRCHALLLRAMLRIEKDDLQSAEADLKEVWLHIEPCQDDFVAGGYQSALATWWEATAKVRSRYGDVSGAIAAKREEVKRLRIISQLPQLEGPFKHDRLALGLWKLGKELAANNDPSAEYCFKESRSIRANIGLGPICE